jgi:hypothetical protein
MTARRPCPPAPGPLEDYATQVDPLLASVAQRRGFRDYLQVNDQRVQLLCEDPATAPHHAGALVAMTPATARTAPPPPMWPANISARWARSTTASSP